MTDKLRQAIEQAVAILGPEAPLCSGCVEEWTEALRVLRDALAEQPAEQWEPVAWMVYTMDGKSVCVTDNPADFTDEHRALPLYTAPKPAKREPLTEEEIDALPWWPHEGNPVTLAEGLRDFARAIERAHGIGEQE